MAAAAKQYLNVQRGKTLLDCIARVGIDCFLRYTNFGVIATESPEPQPRPHFTESEASCDPQSCFHIASEAVDFVLREL